MVELNTSTGLSINGEDDRTINPPDNLPIESEPSPAPPAPEEAPVQEFFKREEIKTMGRDTAELREAEAKAEKERIASLKAEIKIQQPLGAPQATIPPAPPLTSAPISQSASFNPYKKFIIRGLIVLISLFVLGFVFWLWQGKKQTAPEQPAKTETPAVKPELTLTPSLISTQNTRIIRVAANEEIPAALEQSSKTEIAAGTFARIAIKNTVEDRWASFDDLASAFGINVPAGILEKLDPNFFLAFFSQKEGVRIALAAKTTDSLGLTELLKLWENSAPFKPQTSFFKIAHYQGKTFKYLTLGQNDFGIVYMVLDDYLVLTSSYASMRAIADQIISATK